MPESLLAGAREVLGASGFPRSQSNQTRKPALRLWPDHAPGRRHERTRVLLVAVILWLAARWMTITLWLPESGGALLDGEVSYLLQAFEALQRLVLVGSCEDHRCDG